MSDPAALARAVEITAAKIHNSSVLVERQAKGGGHLWVHGGECHAEHTRRRAALVAEIMAAAGYGAETEGKAA